MHQSFGLPGFVSEAGGVVGGRGGGGEEWLPTRSTGAALSPPPLQRSSAAVLEGDFPASPFGGGWSSFGDRVNGGGGEFASESVGMSGGHPGGAGGGGGGAVSGLGGLGFGSPVSSRPIGASGSPMGRGDRLFGGGVPPASPSWLNSASVADEHADLWTLPLGSAASRSTP